MTAPASRRNDEDTAKDAGAASPETRRTLRAECLAILREAGPTGLTDHELAAELMRRGVLCAGQTSAGKRRLELEREGYVCRVAGPDRKPLRRRTPFGSTAFVWAAVPGTEHYEAVA